MKRERWFSAIMVCMIMLVSQEAYAGIEMRDSVLWIGEDVESLEEEMFRDREDISEVVFADPSRIKQLPTGLFRGCSNLRRVSLPSGLETIGAHSFAYCGRLENIDFPEGLIRIGNNAFSRCMELRCVKLPASVTALESYAFSDCGRLAVATLPANGSMLGELIFSGCVSLELIEEFSPVPPVFDCASFIFEPEERDMYRRTRLKVKPEAEASYRLSPGWMLFY